MIDCFCSGYQEALQKEAFEALQLQKDTKHQRLTNQIDLIEQELAQLSLIEVEQRHLRSTTRAVRKWLADSD